MKRWHWLAVGVAVVAIAALLTMTIGTRLHFGSHARVYHARD